MRTCNFLIGIFDGGILTGQTPYTETVQDAYLMAYCCARHWSNCFVPEDELSKDVKLCVGQSMIQRQAEFDGWKNWYRKRKFAALMWERYPHLVLPF